MACDEYHASLSKSCSRPILLNRLTFCERFTLSLHFHQRLREKVHDHKSSLSMQRISKILGALSGSYLQLCRCSLSRLAQTQLALGDDDVVLPKMPHFDYFSPPYTRLSAVEILKKRQEYLSPSLFHFYSNLVSFWLFQIQFGFKNNIFPIFVYLYGFG